MPRHTRSFELRRGADLLDEVLAGWPDDQQAATRDLPTMARALARGETVGLTAASLLELLDAATRTLSKKKPRR